MEWGDEESVVDDDDGPWRNDDGIFLNAVKRFENILNQRNLRCTTYSKNVEVTLRHLLRRHFLLLILLKKLEKETKNYVGDRVLWESYFWVDVYSLNRFLREGDLGNARNVFDEMSKRRWGMITLSSSSLIHLAKKKENTNSGHGHWVFSHRNF